MMTRTRALAAMTAILTALLLQATLIGPITTPIPVSLPALMIAAVALVDGPGAGMALGFSAGLVADLGSSHPAGVFALCWLALGLVCGLAAERGSVRRDAAIAAVASAGAATAATLLLAIVHAGGATVLRAAHDIVPTALGDAILALAVVPVVRAFLRNGAMRAGAPTTQLVVPR